MVSTIMAPALPAIASELHMTRVESVMALSSFMLATAFGPLVMGPLSEIYGREPILHVSNIWFIVFNLVCGFANTKGTLIASRLLAGFGASAIYSLAGGVLGDVWRPEQRGRTLAIYLLIPLLGAAVGPVIGGFVAARSTWRWMFWSTSAFQGVMTVASFVAFHETYAPVILKQRAKKVRRTTGNQNYYTAAERADARRSITGVLSRSLSRPLRLLALHPIIQVMAFLSAFYYGIQYIVLSTFSSVWVSGYHESVEISGLHYLAPAFGVILGSQLGGPCMDFIFRKLKDRAGGEIVPELHLPLLLPGAIIAPIGLFIYGWSAQFKVHWAIVDIAIAINSFGLQISTMAIQAYVIDAYPEHTSSASAASQFVRSLTAFAFPLFAPKLYSSLGYGLGNTTIGITALAVGVPAPILVWMYGARLRAKAQSSY